MNFSIESNSGLIHASKNAPCLHCGKPDWCYSVGELTVCKRGAEPAQGWVTTGKQDKSGDPYYSAFQEKSLRPKSTKNYFYPDRNGDRLVRVKRIDNGDGTKKFIQGHWNGHEWIDKNPAHIKCQVPIYRYEEVRRAIADGELIFIVEGEKVADILWSKGIAATAFIGGTRGYKNYGTDYKQDLAGASVVLCPDRDVPGMKYMQEIYKDFPNAQWLFAPPNAFFWENLPQDQGLDVGDWISEGASLTDIMQQLTQDPTTYLSNNLQNSGDSDNAVTITSDNKKKSKSTIEAIVTTVTTILGKGLGEREESYQLYQLYLDAKIDRRIFDRIIATEKVRIKELDAEVKERLNALIESGKVDIKWEEVLPMPLARDMLHDAAVRNIDPVIIWQTLLSAVASLIGIRLKLDVESHVIPALLWSVTVVETGAGKSRADDLVLAPLRDLQQKENERHADALKAYKLAIRQWEKDGSPEGEEPAAPALRKYLFDIATIQSVVRRCAENGNHGALWARDELDGLFSSLGQFSKQADEGQQILLKLWNGGALSSDRVSISDSFFAPDSALSLTGGLQPAIFRKIFQDVNDSTGLQARFLFAVPDRLPLRRKKGYCRLSDRLPLLYSWLDALPETTIKLSQGADALYTELIDLSEEELTKASNPAIRAWLAKWATQTMRIALILHVLECFYHQSDVSSPMSAETLERAITIAQYYRNAFNFLQEKVSDSDDLASVLLQIQDRAHQSPTGISIRDLYRNIKALTRLAKEEQVEASPYTEKLCQQLTDMGYGQIVRKGRSVKYIAHKKKIEIPSIGIGDNGDNSPEPQQNQGSYCRQEPVTIDYCHGDNDNYHLNTESKPCENVTEILPNPINEEIYIPSPDDPEIVAANACLLRDAIAEKDWTMITDLGGGWQRSFKDKVWESLTQAERDLIRAMVPENETETQPESEKKPEPQPEKEPETKKISDGWQNCIIKNLKEGDRISCYPTEQDADAKNKKARKAKVIALESDSTNTFLMGIQVEYTYPKKDENGKWHDKTSEAYIPGGCIQEWVLRRI